MTVNDVSPTAGGAAHPAIDDALRDLARERGRWLALGMDAKIGLLDRLLDDTHTVAAEWATASAAAKGVADESREAGEEWVTVAFLLRAIFMLRASFRDIARVGRPRIPGPITRSGDNQLRVRVFPSTVYDRVFFPGMTAEIWTEPGVTEDEVVRTPVSMGGGEGGRGTVALVLGAGNVSILGPCDVLNKLFCEGAVVVYKTHPVLDYLTPLLRRAFAGLIEAGVLRIVSGGAAEGAYLAHHPLVDELHLTGSDRTYDAMVFGTGEEGRRRKEAGERLLTKRFTCELGNVSPVIVVPGPWTESDLRYQAEHLAAMLVVNAGFNCLASRVIIQDAGWPLGRRLLDELRRVLARTPPRPAYYPGAREIHSRFVGAHPEAERFGDGRGACLPWTLIAGLDPRASDDICFTTEGFCSLFAETALDAPDVPAFIDAAVRLANETLWGSLTSTLLVHPASLADPNVAAAVERATRDLRYGTVGVNAWGASGFLTMAASWGAFPGHPPTDIQSGHGTVHNFLMIPRPQKTVLRGPFRQSPKPLVFPSHRTLPALSRRLVEFEYAPSLPKLLGIVLTALRG